MVASRHDKHSITLDNLSTFESGDRVPGSKTVVAEAHAMTHVDDNCFIKPLHFTKDFQINWVTVIWWDIVEALTLDRKKSCTHLNWACELKWILKYDLQWAKADCFDYAIVLASFLLGVGYDVFCVVGYAPRAITTNDQVGVAVTHSNGFMLSNIYDTIKTRSEQWDGSLRNVHAMCLKMQVTSFWFESELTTTLASILQG